MTEYRKSGNGASASEADTLRFEVRELEREREARKLRVITAEDVTSERRDIRVVRAMLSHLCDADLHGEAAAYIAHEIAARLFALRNIEKETA
ncbi:MAG TPA: hypothetical protein VNQ78_07595 [Paracoccus sp. (in: a-proteobacteria)]|nr:hypothetical protein [Paracoccus sp. (in: a-proteobacteria)]